MRHLFQLFRQVILSGVLLVACRSTPFLFHTFDPPEKTVHTLAFLRCCKNVGMAVIPADVYALT